MPKDFATLDLFAGAGGLSQGLRSASSRFHAHTAVEFDRAAAATYAHNFPEADVHPMPIEAWLDLGRVPQVDVVVGGPPCQGFSALGKQDIHDERNRLWMHYALAVRESKAKYFVIENVPQFRRSPQFELFRREIAEGTLRDYDFDVQDLNAADYGAPQARKRTIVLGHRKDVRPLEFPDATHAGNPMTVAEAFAGVPSKTRGIDLPDRWSHFDGNPVRGPFTLDELHLTRNYTDLSLKRFAHIGPGQNRFAIPHELLSPCWRRHTSGSGDVMGRLHLDKPSVTIRTEFFKPEKGRYLHPSAHRAITHLEAGVLQGFPRDSMWFGSKLDIARQIGNAVPIPLGAAIGRSLLAAIDGAAVEHAFDVIDHIDGVDVLPEPKNAPATVR